MFRNTLLAFGCLLLTVVAAQSDDSIAPETVQAVKQASVFIRVDIAGKDYSGSGFVVHTKGDTALIVTNHHVIAGPDDAKAKLDIFRVPISSKITAVFDSGMKNERSATAEIVAADESTDLAVLRVTGVKDLPIPVAYSNPPKVAETTPLWTFGFPFGQMLALGKGNPTITVGKAAVSSLRTDDDGELVLIQIDGALNPGNSGGPVVGSNGKLIGVAVMTIKSAGIGFVIPAEEIERIFAGRTGPGRAMIEPVANGKRNITVELPVLDPMNKIRVKKLHVAVGTKNEADPKRSDPLSKRAGALSVNLTRQKNSVVADFPIQSGTGDKVYIQPEWEDEAGNTVLGRVSIFPITGLFTNNRTVVQQPPPPPNTTQPPGFGPPPNIGVRPPSIGVGPPRFGTRPPVVGPAPPVVGSTPPVGQTQRQEDRVESTPLIITNDVKLGHTGVMGGAFGREPYRDVAPEGAWLVGLEVGKGRYLNYQVIRSVRAVFRTGENETFGVQHGTDLSDVVRLVAKPGYAVGAITVKSGANADGVSITYMKIKGDQLDPKDTYESDWVGDTRPGGKRILTGNGKPPVGIVGTKNADHSTGIGLLFDRKAK